MIDISKIKDIAEHAKWYHTIQLTSDIKTNGTYDHSLYLKKYGFPVSLSGLKVLDVGAADGFFSFEFEKRGADDILAIDTNCSDGSMAISPSPSFAKNYTKKYDDVYHFNEKFKSIYNELGLSNPNMFLIAKTILESKVRYEQRNIYDMDGKFDFVFCGDLIEHLKNPLEAVENLYRLTKKQCIVSLSSVPEGSDSNETLMYRGNVAGGSFFHFHTGTFREVLLASGFKTVNILSVFDLASKRSTRNKHAIYQCMP